MLKFAFGLAVGIPLTALTTTGIILGYNTYDILGACGGGALGLYSGKILRDYIHKKFKPACSHKMDKAKVGFGYIFGLCAGVGLGLATPDFVTEPEVNINLPVPKHEAFQ